MVREDEPRVTKKPVSLLLVEGYTETLFYKRIKNNFLNNCRVTIRNLEGLYNINKKVITAIEDYVQQHKDEQIRAYCCFDRESRYGEVPEFNIKKVKKHIKNQNMNKVLSINLIKATQEIESWFLSDIEGIYQFLKVPKPQRNLRAFEPPEKFGYKDLQRLFERNNKIYSKGRNATNFINSLNINKIVSNCKELREGIKLIQSQATGLTNHLFPTRKRKEG